MAEKQRALLDGLTDKERRFIEKIRAVELGNFSGRWVEAVLIANLSENNASLAVFNLACRRSGKLSDVFHHRNRQGERTASLPLS